MENKISETIRELRKQRGISQEVLASALGISIQAISKWETGNSLPDILLIPDIAKFFGITIDELFCGIRKNENDFIGADEIREDGILRVVQFLGRTCLGAKEWKKGEMIELKLPESENKINVEIWGNAQIQGDIQGSIQCGDGVNCGNVGHSIQCGDGVNCGNVGHSVSCGDGVNCGNINGSVSSGGDIHCNEIREAKSIKCEKIICSGSVTVQEVGLFGR